MKVNFEIGSKERLLEMMGNVNKEFKPHAENQIIKSITAPVNEDQPEVDHGDDNTPEVSQADIESSNALEAQANTTPSEQDIEKPAIDSRDQKTVFTVTVPVHKKQLATKNIESMKKMARKLSLPEPEITIGNPYQTKQVVRSGDDGNGGQFSKTYVVEVYDITINTSKMFRFGGQYDLIAVVDNISGGSIEINPEKKVPVEYLQPSDQCDLCHQERYRGKCFVVTDAQGDYKRLGSSCVKKYIGIDPYKFVKAIAFISDFSIKMDELGDEQGFSGGGGRGGWSETTQLTDFALAVSVINDIIKTDGFEKKLYSDDRYRPERTNRGNATSEKAEGMLLNDEKIKNYPIDNALVQEFTQYLNDLQVDPNKGEGLVQFFTNLKALPEKNVRVMDSGLIASGLNMFNKHKDQIAKNAAVKDSQWIGEVGTKVKFPYAKLVGANSGQGAYGTWFLWSFIDNNGNSLKKFGTISDKFKIESAPEDAENLYGFNAGDVFAFTAEIKSHDTYKDVKSTMLGRLSKA